MMLNAYSMNASCRAGIPFLQAFQMTGAYAHLHPNDGHDGIHPNVKIYEVWSEILSSFFKKNN